MKFLPSRRFKVNPRDPEVIARSQQQHVIELAHSIQQLGGEPAHQPVLTAAGAFVAGRDRHAAMALLGRETFEARVVEGTPLELEALELSENLHRRRDDRDALIARFVAVTEKLLMTDACNRAGIDMTLPPPVAADREPVAKSDALAVALPIGRPQTPRGKAREHVASALGIKPESVRAAEHREAKKKEPSGSRKDPTVEPPLGWEVEAYNDGLGSVLEQIRCAKSDTKLVAKNNDGKLPTAAFDRIVQELDNLKFMTEACRLVAKCPACKGVEMKCSLCSGFRVVTQFQLSGWSAPPSPTPQDIEELEPVDDTENF